MNVVVKLCSVVLLMCLLLMKMLWYVDRLMLFIVVVLKWCM